MPEVKEVKFGRKDEPAGTLRKSGTGNARIGMNLVNTGTIDAQGGKLRLSQENATTTLNAGTTITGTGLLFNGGFMVMTGTTTVNSPNSFELSTG